MKKQKIYYFHIVGLRSKRLYKSFVLFYPLIVQLHPYGVSLWLKYGTHDSGSVALYPWLVKYMCGRLVVKGWNVSRQGYQPTGFHVCICSVEPEVQDAVDDAQVGRSFATCLSLSYNTFSLLISSKLTMAISVLRLKSNMLNLVQ